MPVDSLCSSSWSLVCRMVCFRPAAFPALLGRSFRHHDETCSTGSFLRRGWANVHHFTCCSSRRHYEAVFLMWKHGCVPVDYCWTHRRRSSYGLAPGSSGQAKHRWCSNVIYHSSSAPQSTIPVHNLGVVLDSQLTMSNHITNVCRSGY